MAPPWQLTSFQSPAGIGLIDHTVYLVYYHAFTNSYNNKSLACYWNWSKHTMNWSLILFSGEYWNMTPSQLLVFGRVKTYAASMSVIFIHGYHPWMRQRMTDMDAAIVMTIFHVVKLYFTRPWVSMTKIVKNCLPLPQ